MTEYPEIRQLFFFFVAAILPMFSNKCIMNRFVYVFILISAFFSCKKEKDCPQNFTGSNCEQEVTPTRVRVTAIQFTNYPSTNNGVSWDTQSQWADPYFEIRDLNGVVYSSEYLNEKPPVSINQWVLNIVLDPNDPYVILFYDEDGTNDTLIDSSVLYNYIPGRGFPDKYTFNGSGGSQITVWVTYEY